MDRRNFLGLGITLVGGNLVGLAGCRGYQHARVMKDSESDTVGSHAAGAETYKPLIQQSVSKLLGRACTPSEIQPASMVVGERKKICFIGVENCTAEEIGDFREQIYELIDSAINESKQYEQLSRRYVENGLKQLRLRPDELFVQENQRNFQVVMEKMEQPFDYLLYAKLTSGTTKSNGDYQRDYLLTLELVNIHDGHYEKESASIRKGYRRSLSDKLFH
ncbi:MAG: penicillin-binding protein activator LpoB [Planctomycetaceae bacterium]